MLAFEISPQCFAQGACYPSTEAHLRLLPAAALSSVKMLPKIKVHSSISVVSKVYWKHMMKHGSDEQFIPSILQRFLDVNLDPFWGFKIAVCACFRVRYRMESMRKIPRLVANYVLPTFVFDHARCQSHAD